MSRTLALLALAATGLVVVGTWLGCRRAERTCDRPPTGWVCRLGRGHNGSCPAYVAWWNLPARVRLRSAVRPRHDDGLSTAVLAAAVVLAACGVAMVAVR